jgi:hypothetical protein
MGYLFVIGPCWGCKRVFTYNPVHVPSVNNDGVCSDCMAEINRQLVAKGHEAIEIHAEAYEPANENEV